MEQPFGAQTDDSGAAAVGSRPSSSNSLANKEEPTCPECGGAIQADDVICPHCGVPLAGG